MVVEDFPQEVGSIFFYQSFLYFITMFGIPFDLATFQYFFLHNNVP